jgi:hypothetical protein
MYGVHAARECITDAAEKISGIHKNTSPVLAEAVQGIVSRRTNCQHSSIHPRESRRTIPPIHPAPARRGFKYQGRMTITKTTALIKPDANFHTPDRNPTGYSPSGDWAKDRNRS